MQRDYDYIFKISFVGEVKVGKTSLIHRYADDSFDDNVQPTLGVDFRFKSTNCRNNFVKLQLWDTAGQQTFRSIIDRYYKNSDAVVIVYDVLDSHSFMRAQQYWLEEVRSKARRDCLIYLLANKCEEGRVGWQEKIWCQRERIMCCEVSAKTGQGVAEAVDEIVSALVQVRPKVEKEKITMALNQNGIEPKKGCCQ